MAQTTTSRDLTSLSMFKPGDIQCLLKASPFMPFCLYFQGGHTFRVSDPNGAWIGQRFIDIGINLNSDGFAEYSMRYYLMQLTRIQVLGPCGRPL